MGLVMPPKEYRSLIDDFVQVVKWTAITFLAAADSASLVDLMLLSWSCTGTNHQ